MKQTKTFHVIGWLSVALVVLSAFGCPRISQKDSGHSVISPVPVEPGRPIEPAQEPSPLELYYGEGDCGPRFPNGMRGTCINNKPCNGFGVKNEKGEMECECFGVKGGCAEGLICSAIKRACVPLSKADHVPPAKSH